MSVAVDFVAGTVGGAAAVLIEHPFDTIKVLMQAGRYDGYLSCIRGVLAKEGPRGFYRGMSARLVASGFEHAVVFASYKYSIRAVGGDEDRPTVWQVCVGGCGSGVAGMLCLTPFELVKCKLQADDDGAAVAERGRALGSRGGVPAKPPAAAVITGSTLPTGATVAHTVPAGIERASLGVDVRQLRTAATTSPGAEPAAYVRQYTSSWDCAKKIYRRKGIPGLYRGGVATLYREVPGTAAWCGTYDYLKHVMTPPGQNPKQLPLWKLMLAGGCAGVTYWVAMFPADVVKTRMQVDADFEGLSFAQAVRRQFRQCGWKGLYKGFGLTAARSFPSNAVIFMCFDVCSRTLMPPEAARCHGEALAA